MSPCLYISQTFLPFEIELSGFNSEQLELVAKNSSLAVSRRSLGKPLAGRIFLEVDGDPAFQEQLAGLTTAQPSVLSGAEGVVVSSPGGQVLLPWSGSEVKARVPASGGAEFYFVFETALFRILAEQGSMSLHAALVSINGRNLLLVGKGGSGKSTLTLLLMQAGAKVLSDDSVLLSLQSGEFEVWGIRPFMVLREPALRVIDEHLMGQVIPFTVLGECKYRLSLGSELSCTASGIDAMLLLDGFVEQPESVLNAAHAGQVYARLVSQSSALYFTDAFRAEQKALQPVITRLIETVPTHLLQLGGALMDSENCQLELERLLAEVL